MFSNAKFHIKGQNLMTYISTLWKVGEGGGREGRSICEHKIAIFLYNHRSVKCPIRNIFLVYLLIKNKNILLISEKLTEEFLQDL